MKISKAFLYLLSTVLSVSFLISCKSTNQGSSLKHEIGHPVESNNKYFWTSVSYAEYIKSEGLSSADAKKLIFDDEFPMTKRLQYWVDLLDSHLRTTYPDQFSHVPKPKVRLIASNEINGYVSALPICFDNVLFSANKNPQFSRDISESLAMYKDNFLYPIKAPCHHMKAEEGPLLHYLSLLNSADESCQWNLKSIGSDQFRIDPSSECRVDETLKPGSSLASNLTYRFSILSSMSDFTIKSKLVETLEEDELVAVLFHELKHYYGGHNGISGKNYFYHIAEDATASAPPRAQDLRDLDIRLTRFKRAQNESSLGLESLKSFVEPKYYDKVQGQKVSTGLANLLAEQSMFYRNSHCNSGNARCKTCSQLDKIVSSNTEALKRIRTAPYGLTGTLNGDQKREYLEFETAALACLSTVEFVEGGNVSNIEISGSSFESEVLNRYVYLDTSALSIPTPSGTYSEYLMFLSKYLDDQNIFNFDESSFVRLPLLQKKYAELKTLLDEANAQLESIEEESEQQKLGYYSLEQEADEASVEFMSNLGLDVTADIYGNLKGGIANEPEEFSKCLSWYKNDWKDSQGKPIFIGWGPISDDHPNSCFRSRNVSREIAAHGYPITKKSASAGLKPSWTELKDSMLKRIADGNIDSPTLKLASRSKYERFLSCRRAASRAHHLK
ncbi:MAG: hypothetical protein EOP04_08130 [Proteobacteria bacterium]|nr:MAG: hypothetical protein EOP04_08130 [Pseudomonadota bacterium]